MLVTVYRLLSLLYEYEVHLAPRGIARDDKFHSFAQSTLSKMSGVEITGERTKQERDDEKRDARVCGSALRI